MELDTGTVAIVSTVLFLLFLFGLAYILSRIVGGINEGLGSGGEEEFQLKIKKEQNENHHSGHGRRNTVCYPIVSGDDLETHEKG